MSFINKTCLKTLLLASLAFEGSLSPVSTTENSESAVRTEESSDTQYLEIVFLGSEVSDEGQFTNPEIYSDISL